MTSLNATISTAMTLIQTVQSQTSVTANNIANADTDGFTRKTAEQTSVVSAGIGAGVTITGVTSDVDPLLLKHIVSALGEAASASVTQEYAEAMASLLGTTDGSVSTLSSGLDDLQSALIELEASPASATLKEAVVGALDDITAQLRGLSADVQALRAQADQEIATTVDAVNAALADIDQLNESIRQAEAAGQPTVDLEDQRQAALNIVAAAMSVSTFTSANGDLYVYTKDGTPLVDSDAHVLTFDAAGVVTDSSTLGAGLSGITVDGKDITDEVRTGSLGALFEQRDEVLPAVQEELDALAVALIDGFNAAHGAGTSVPASNELTGTTALTSSDAITATGTLRVVITDEDGMVQNLADIDMSTIATVGDLVTTLDGIPGLDASLDADGHLSLTTTVAGTGVALDASATDMGAGQTLTTEYGINAALTGTSAADIDVADWLDADSSRLAVATVSDDAALAVGDNAIASGDSSGVERLLSVLTEDVSIGAAGSLPATEGTLSAYAGDILGAAAVRLDAAESAATTTTSVLSTLEDRLSSETGVNLDEETARLEELQTAYEAGAQLLSIVQEMFDTLLDAVN